MERAGGTTAARRRSSPALVGLVVAAVVGSVVWWSAAATVIAPGHGGGGGSAAGSAAPTGLRVQAGAGRSIVAHWSPARSGPPATSYQVTVVTAGGGRTVATAEAWSPSAVVGGLDVGGRYQLVVTPSGGGPPATSATSAPVVVLADQRPDPPARVTITQLPGTNGLRVDWTPNPHGMAARGAIVQLYDGLAYWGYVRCEAECTTAAFRGLSYGRRYTVKVVPLNGAGEGPATGSSALDLRSSCPAIGACVTVDATAAIGPARLRAQGFLNSLYPVGAMVALTRALAPQSWRGSPIYQPATGTLDWSSWDTAVASGARTTMLLSNLWHAETSTGTGARPPWSDWAAYATWVANTVGSIEASGHPVSFWEIQNEPASPTYLSPADWTASTVADYLQQFQVAYTAIKAADPTAQIIGPSLSHFADYPDEYNPHELDLVTFLDFAASHGMHLAAITWHEIDDDLGSQPRDFNLLPQMIEDHVAEARRLIAERPALGHPEVWVNEYGRPQDYAIPGWTLGDIAALERASVDRAGRSCWPEKLARDLALDDCAAATLDGLLGPDGSTPRADYWVYAAYARMTGRVVASTSSDAAVSVLAAGDDASGQVVAMVGRDVSCLPVVNLDCTLDGALAVPPVAVSVGVRVPWATALVDVTIARVPPTWGPVLQPSTISHGRMAVTKGGLILSLPSVADGEVYLVTIGR